jgi:hypothetical protein
VKSSSSAMLIQYRHVDWFVRALYWIGLQLSSCWLQRSFKEVMEERSKKQKFIAQQSTKLEL